MHFDLIDEYLLTGSPRKAEVVERLLADRSTISGAAPFYEGMKILGARTPDLTLVALRLVMAGKHADDANVVALREQAEKARAGGEDAPAARLAYKQLLAGLALALLFAFAGGAAPVSAQGTPPPKHTHAMRGSIRSVVTGVVLERGRYYLKIKDLAMPVEITPATEITKGKSYASLSDLRPGVRVLVDFAGSGAGGARNPLAEAVQIL